MKEKIMLRSKAKALEPVLRMGKEGLSENFIEEVNKVLKKRKLIKIKLLKTSFDKKNKKEMMDSIIQRTNSELIDAVGNIIVIHKK